MCCYEAGASQKSEAKAFTLVKALLAVMCETELFHGADPSCISVLLPVPIHRNKESRFPHTALMREKLSSNCHLYQKQQQQNNSYKYVINIPLRSHTLKSEKAKLLFLLIYFS